MVIKFLNLWIDWLFIVLRPAQEYFMLECILTRILTGPLSVAFSDTQGDVEDLF